MTMPSRMLLRAAPHTSLRARSASLSIGLTAIDAHSAGSSMVAGFSISPWATAAFVSPLSAAARSRLWKKNSRMRKTATIPKISA